MTVIVRRIDWRTLFATLAMIALAPAIACAQEQPDERANQFLDQTVDGLRMGISRLKFREQVPKAIEVTQAMGIGRPDLLIENYDGQGGIIDPNQGSILNYLEKVRETRVYHFEASLFTSMSISIRKPSGEGEFPDHIIKLTRRLLGDGQMQMALLDKDQRAPTVVWRGEATCLFVVWQDPDTVSVWVCKGPGPRHIVLEDLKTRSDYEAFQKFARRFGV